MVHKDCIENIVFIRLYPRISVFSREEREGPRRKATSFVKKCPFPGSANDLMRLNGPPNEEPVKKTRKKEKKVENVWNLC